jgi:hypothetical protein
MTRRMTDGQVAAIVPAPSSPKRSALPPCIPVSAWPGFWRFGPVAAPGRGSRRVYAARMKPGNILLLVGTAIVIIGVILRFAPWLVSWFGRLPGDVRIETESTRVYIPITSMILVSLALTVVANVVWRLRR